MRELKFRVWSEEDREYWTDCKLRYLFTSPTGLPSTVYNDEGDRFDIEQYTGLKDKNGKEIYEGDIVTLNGEWEEIEHDDCSIVTFENGCFRVGDGYENEAGSYLSDWRIIGNIHEDPELLEGEKCGN